jgi:acyl-CoA oxidase
LNFPNTILEGENTILLLQVARELLKSMEMASRGENQKLIGSLKYLSQIEVHNNYKAPEKREDYRQVGTYISIFSRIVCMLVQKGGMKMMTCLGEGVKARDAFDQKIGITIVDAAKVHTVLFTLRFFDKKVRSIGEGPVKLALSRLALLYAIDQLFVYCKQGLETDTLNNTIVSICGEVYEELLEQIHPDALNLIEGYGFPDDMIRSSIGHSNGKPYENLYMVAKNNGLLNTFDVHPAMLTYIKNQYAGREHEQEESSAKPKL